MTAEAVLESLKREADPERAKLMQRYFKTGPGQYGEGDLFLGLTVPQARRFVGEFRELPLTETLRLLRSPLHEARFVALLLQVRSYQKGAEPVREEIYRAYCGNTSFINNWDLVDCSAGHIVGAHLHDRPRSLLYTFADSRLLWERRIAVMATYHFIRQGEYTDTLRIAELLLADREDLIHKAVGWMLREIGNRDREAEEGFLRRHYRVMPRTMLRYAIEKFPESLRKGYLKGTL